MPDVETILADRGSRYGDFTDNAQIAENILAAFRGDGYLRDTNWTLLDSVKRQALTYMAMKLSRILSPSADEDYRDNWDDIAGYAKLVSDRCDPPAEEIDPYVIQPAVGVDLRSVSERTFSKQWALTCNLSQQTVDVLQDLAYQVNRAILAAPYGSEELSALGARKAEIENELDRRRVAS